MKVLESRMSAGNAVTQMMLNRHSRLGWLGVGLERQVDHESRVRGALRPESAKSTIVSAVIIATGQKVGVR